MEIGINLDHYTDPMVDLENLICDYGKKREIGYLKINPERIPVIISEGKAQAEIDRFGEHMITYPLCGSKFVLITDDRAISQDLKDLALRGNAYIARKQSGVFTALDLQEILEWLLQLCELEYEAINSDDGRYDTYVFEYDEDRGCWK